MVNPYSDMMNNNPQESMNMPVPGIQPNQPLSTELVPYDRRVAQE